VVGVAARGAQDGEIERVARLIVYDVLGREPPKEGGTQGNPWGAMPSDHISSAAITVCERCLHCYWRRDPSPLRQRR